jgi:hypothetical protein
MATKKRNVLDDLKDKVTESEFLELPKVAAKAAKKVVTKEAAKGAPPAAKTVSRGAVVKQENRRGGGRGAGNRVPPYKPGAKITVIEGVRNYRQPGKVYDAVQLMKKHGTVEAYEKAMEKSENDLPALGLLRYLHKKQVVKVD